MIANETIIDLNSNDVDISIYKQLKKRLKFPDTFLID